MDDLGLYAVGLCSLLQVFLIPIPGCFDRNPAQLLLLVCYDLFAYFIYVLLSFFVRSDHLASEAVTNLPQLFM